MSTPIHLLLVEDSDDDAQLIVRLLRQSGYDVTHRRVDSAAALEDALEDSTWDAVTSDFSMPGFDGLQALEMVRAKDRDLPFIFVSGTIGETRAVEAMRAGAKDYVMKGNLTRLPPLITRELRDTRTRKHLQAQFLQAQKMESVGQLAGGIAHDFNNLLTVISSYCEFLLEDIPADDVRRDDVVQIQSAASQATHLSRQLLMFSRNEVLRPESVPVDKIAADVAKLLHRIIGANIELVLSLHAEGVMVEVDPGMLTQAVINLAINARDAMPSGGKLIIETRVVPHERPRVELAVSDNGVGMDAATQARIFEPFFTTKAAGKGTGLGLSQVYTVVTQYRGTVGVYSEPGLGTTIKIDLPCVAASSAALPTASAPPESARAAETVLIVEDAAAVRTVTRQVLERFGYAVLEAPDGMTALQVASRHHGPIHLLLTDLVMPGISGRSLAEQFRGIRPDTRVLFTSGYANEAAAQIGVVETNVQYLHKPFTPDFLARTVRAAIDAPQ